MNHQSLQYVSKILDTLVQLSDEPGDLNRTLQHIADSAQKFFSADVCTIIALNPITRSFIEPVTVAGNAFTQIVYEKPRPQGITNRVLKAGLVMIDDLEVRPDYQGPFARQEQVRALAALVLHARHRQNQLGVLYLNFRHKKRFTSEDKELLQIFADQASFILQETWLLLHCKEVEAIGQEINQDLATVENLFAKLQPYVVKVLDTSYTLLLAVHQRQTNKLDFYIQEEGNSIQLHDYPLGGACQYILEQKTTWVIDHRSKDEEDLPFQLIPIKETGTKESYIFVPLLLRDTALGVLSIQHPEPGAYDQEDLFILQLLANHISLALHNIRLYESLTRLSKTGQHLIQQLDSEQTLQSTVDEIYSDTQADSVILYDYDPITRHFGHLPHSVGTFLDSDLPSSMYPTRIGNIAKLMLLQNEPIFAKDSSEVYDLLEVHPQSRQGRFAQREHIRSAAAIRLSVRDEVVGVLFINFRQPQRFDATQKLLIEGLASYAAIAIKNAQAFVTLNQRRQREAMILQNIHRDLNGNLDLKSVLDTLIVQANELIQADRATIMLYDAQKEALEIRAAVGNFAATGNALIIPFKEPFGITRWVLEHKKPARVNNVHSDPRWRELYIEAAYGIISELDIPLVDDTDIVGVLNFESSKEYAFSRDDENFLLTLAGQTVLAVKKAQAYEREKRLAEEREALNQISREIISRLNSSFIFDLILEKALELTDSSLGALLLYNAERGDLWMAAQRGKANEWKSLRMPLSRGIVGYVATRKKTANVVDITQSPWKERYVVFTNDTMSELAVPMLEDIHVLRGVLNVESPECNHFSESDERLLQGLADLAVVALQTTERYEASRKEAQRVELLYEAGQELGKITSLDTLHLAYNIVVQIAKKQSQGNVVIRRYENSTEELVLIDTAESQPSTPALFPRLKISEGINGQVARERRTIVSKDINNPPADIVYARLPEPSPIRSLLVTPIIFGNRYYGNLELNYEDIGDFQDADVNFIVGLAQQLATTIYRLEVAQRSQETERWAASVEAMGWIGQLIFEVAHRRGNDLGLVKSYANDIKAELDKCGVDSATINKKLDQIVRDARMVLDMNKEIKQVMATLDNDTSAEPGNIYVQDLLDAARRTAQEMLIEACNSTIQINPLAISDDATSVSVIHKLATHILQNLVKNAIEAMPNGGELTLKAYNDGHYVALEVIDTGVGIPQGKEEKIFDLTYSTKGSTGFGLWSAYRNARHNQGDLRVVSQPGRTVFTLFLPRVDERSGEHYAYKSL